MTPLNLDLKVKPKPRQLEIKKRFTVLGWHWIGLVNGLEVCEGTYSAVRDCLQELEQHLRSAVDIQREQEPPPRASKRYIFWNASKQVTRRRDVKE